VTPTRQPAPVPSLRRAGLAALLAALLLPCLGPASARASEWFPLEPGRRWAYRTHRDVSLAPAGRSLERRLQHGRSERKIVPEPGAAGSVALEERRVERAAEGGGPRERELVETRRAVYRETDEGVLLLSEETRGDGGSESRDLVTHTPPVRWLPRELAPGARWSLGRVQQDGLVLELQAQVSGPEDVRSDAGPHPGSLAVRYQGTVTGRARMGAEALEVKEGRYRRTLWLARGTGVVLDESDTDLRLLDAGGNEIRWSQTLRETLQPASAPAGAVR